MSEIAEMIVSAGWEGEAAERGLDRLGAKFDQTVARFRTGNGQFVAYKTIQQQGAEAALEHANLLGQLTGQLQQGAQAARNFGVAITAGITLPLAGALLYITKVGSETQRTLNQFEGAARATAAEMERVRSKARELGADLTLPGTSSKQAAQSMLELNKGGLSIRQSMDAARGSIQLARAAIVSEGEAAKISASALNTFALAGDQAGLVSDVLANAANKSTGDITGFAQGLAQAGQVAHSSNVSLEETVAVLALMAQAGVRGADAGTSFKTFLLALRGPSDDARKAIAELSKASGIDVSPYDKLTGRLRPLPEIVGAFSTALKGVRDDSRDAALDKIFGSDAARVAIALFGEGREGLEKYVAAMSEAGTAQRVAEANTKGLAGAWDSFLSTVETIADDIFQDLAGPLEAVVRLMTDAAQRAGAAWNAMGPGVKAAVFGVLAFAAAIGPVIVAVAGAASAVLGLMGAVAGFKVAAFIAAAAGTTLAAAFAPVVVASLKVIAVVTALAVIVGGAVALLAAAWATNFFHIRDITFAAFEAIKSHVTASLEIVRTAWARIYPTLQSLAEKGLAAVERAWELVGKHIVNAIAAAWSVIGPLFRQVLKIVLDVVDLILKVIDGDWDRAWEAFARLVLDGVTLALHHIENLKTTALQILLAAIVGIVNLGERFKQAAVELAFKFHVGFQAAMMSGVSLLTAAIADAIVLAALGVRVETIAASIGARFLNSLRDAVSKGNSRETAIAKSQGHNGNDGEFVMPGDVGRNAGVPLPTDNAKKIALPGLMGGGGRKAGGGGGESPALKAARAELAGLQVVFRAFERAENARLEDEQHFYDEGLRSIEAYTDARRDARIRLTNEALRVAEAEVAVAKLTKGTAGERAAAVKSALDKVAEAHHNHARALVEIERDAAKARDEESRTAWQHTTQRLETYASAQTDIYQRLADRGVITFAKAQAVIAGAQMEMLVREQVRLERALAKLDPASPQAKDLQGQLQTQNQRIENARAINPYEAADSARRDDERELRRANDLRGVWESIEDAARETEAERLKILEAAGVSRTEIWKRQAQFEIEAENARAARRIDELRREIEFTEKFEANERHKAELVAAYHAEIEAEERASAARRSSIVEDYYAKQDARLRSFAEQAVGSLKKAVDRYREEGFGGFFKSLAEDFQNVLLQMAEDLLKSRLLQLLRTVFKIPAPGSTATANGEAPQTGSGSGAFDFLNDAIRRVLGGDRQQRQAGAAGQVSPSGEVRRAGEAMTDAIESGGAHAARNVSSTGEKTASTLASVGQGIVGTMLAIGSQLANANARGGFWKGLLFAAGVGAINGAFGALTSPSGGGAGGGGGSNLDAGLGSAAPGAFDPSTLGDIGLPDGFAAGGIVRGPGHGASDSILGVDGVGVPTARVSNGEFVINAAATARHRALIEAINSNRLPRFGLGGFLKAMSPLGSTLASGGRSAFGRIFMPGLSALMSGDMAGLSLLGSKKGRQTVAPLSALFGFASGGMVGSGAGLPAPAGGGMAYLPPVSGGGGSGGPPVKVEKHFHLNVQMRGDGSPAQIRKSVGQTRRAYKDMIVGVDRELN